MLAVVAFEVVSRVAAILLSVEAAEVVAVEPSRRCMTGGASELSESTVPVVSATAGSDVLCVVEVDAGRAVSGALVDAEGVV